MGFMQVSTIDTGRSILLPKIFMEYYGWGICDEVMLYDLGGSILVRPRPKSINPSCIHCGKSQQKMVVVFAETCGTCLKDLDL